MRIANPIYREVIVRVLSNMAEDNITTEPKTFVRFAVSTSTAILLGFGSVVVHGRGVCGALRSVCGLTMPIEEPANRHRRGGDDDRRSREGEPEQAGTGEQRRHALRNVATLRDGGITLRVARRT